MRQCDHATRRFLAGTSVGGFPIRSSVDLAMLLCFRVRFLCRPHQSYDTLKNGTTLEVLYSLSGKDGKGDVSRGLRGRPPLTDSLSGGGSVPHACCCSTVTARIHYSCRRSFDHEGIKISQHETQHSNSAWLTRVGSLGGVMKKDPGDGLVSAPPSLVIGHRSTS